MRSEELIACYPRLYHMAQDGSWPLIQRLGLLSTAALVEAFGVEDPRREAIVAEHRPSSMTIRSTVYGDAVVRDQIPMRDSILDRVLGEVMTPADWYRLLNSFVFFWPTEARLLTLLSARAYRGRAHTVLVVDTARLLDHHGERVRLSPINSGSTLFDARPRGRATFHTIDDYPFAEMRRRRGLASAIAEIAVGGGVSPIDPVLVAVTRRQQAEVLEEVWTAPANHSSRCPADAADRRPAVPLPVLVDG